MTKDGGVAPERLAVAEDITKVKKRLKSANKAMQKMDIPAKRLPKKLGS